MSGFLKVYRVKITALGPLHIGAGVKIGKKEYIYDRRADKLYYPKMSDMMREMKERRLLEDFENFLLVSQNSDLGGFLAKNRVDYKKWCGAPIDLRGVVDNKGFNEIHGFIRDPYGLPYVPGSSVKGAFRSIVLFGEARKRLAAGENLSSEINPKNARFKAGENEKKLLYTLRRNEKVPGNATNDIMAAFRFSDSEPISRDSITICQKVDLSKQGNYKPLPTFRECLKPGTTINLTLTVDTDLLARSQNSILKSGFPSSFFQTLDEFNISYDEEFSSYFPGTTPYPPDTIFIGGGSGFLTKTMILGLFNDSNWVKLVSEILDMRFRKHKHYLDLKLGISPRMLKTTEYQGRDYELGMCRVEVSEQTLEV